MKKTKESVTVTLNPLQFAERHTNRSSANFAREKKKWFSVVLLSALSYRERGAAFIFNNIVTQCN